MFQHRIIESRPAEYKRPVFLSNWSAFTPDRWRGSCSSLMVKDTVTFLLGMVWLCGWVCEWPEQGRTPAAILHFFFCQLLFSFPIHHSRALSIVSSRNVTQRLACVASVCVRFSSKERGRRVKDRGKNGASKTAGRGWGRKEGNACLILKTAHLASHAWIWCCHQLWWLTNKMFVLPRSGNEL